MTKKEMAQQIAEQVNLTQLQVLEVIQKVFEGVIGTLADEGRIELRGFGVFKVTKRKPRKARNPRTGAIINVPEKLIVRFKQGLEMEEQLLHKQKTTVANLPQESKCPAALVEAIAADEAFHAVDLNNAKLNHSKARQ